MRTLLMKPAILSAAAAATAIVSSGAGLAHAIESDPQNPQNVPRCLKDLIVRNFDHSPRTEIPDGQSATISWRIAVPANCPNLSFKLDGRFIPAQGMTVVTPNATTEYAIIARWPTQLDRKIASLTVHIKLPPVVTIFANDQVPRFRQAVGIKDEIVRVVNGVELDLARRGETHIGAGVRLLGGRGPRSLGARIFTDERGGKLFVIAGDDVRISGLRIQGPDMGVADGGIRATAIYSDSNTELEIDNNEIYGWKDAAVEVTDQRDRMNPIVGSRSVQIHDNFIHHNQHYAKNGYGVVVGDSAWAYVHRNVFDYNRHAIAGDGSDGSGYIAERNFVLAGGGRHRRIVKLKWIHTHQFDMHGQESCSLGDRNCGTAGHSLYIRRNSFLYTKGASVKLRGTPQLNPFGFGAFVESNVFAKGSIGAAVQQTETGLRQTDNQVGFDGSKKRGSCDFDGDGTNDQFIATGQTWWFATPQTGQWRYLNTARQRLPSLTLRDVTGDGRCDVATNGLVSEGGTGPLLPPS
jgi:hypothetical protein